MLQKRWQIAAASNAAPVTALPDGTALAPIVSLILKSRGITDPYQASAFLKKRMADLSHPFLLKDAKKAATRIADAIASGEQIAIYGDYDVDGITATALMYLFLQSHGANVRYYIPARADEGYGLHISSLKRLYDAGSRLVISVDCGITATEEADFARSIGLDLIITDHHSCKDTLPDAFAVVNPRQPDCAYPFKELAGVGVAFQVVLAAALVMGERARTCFDRYVGLVAIGTVADVVSLTGENRILVAHGLNQLQSTDNVGLRALFACALGQNQALSAQRISFAIAPRINAAGRVAEASLAVELLITDDAARAEEIAALLDEENRHRQALELEILEEADQMLAAMADLDKRQVLVLAREGWHHGVIGIVSSRLVERYYKPVILISLTGSEGKGSGRSIQGFNLFDALCACGDCLSRFGGHALAAGLSIDRACIEQLDREINAYASRVMTEEILTPAVSIDAVIGAQLLTLQNVDALRVLEPFGMGNPQPVLCLLNCTLTALRTLSEGRHCKLTVSQGGRQLDLLAFRMPDLADRFVVGDHIDAAFTLSSNVFRGERSLQLIVRDVRLSIGA